VARFVREKTVTLLVREPSIDIELNMLPAAPMANGGYVLRLFGAMALECGSTRITKFPTRKAALLLARLAVARDQRIGRDELAELLWPDDFLDQTRIRLRQELRRLRQVVGGFGCCLRADRQWVEIEPGCLTTDVQAFDAAIAASNSAIDTVSKAEGLSAAVEYLHGPFLAGYQEPWVHATRRNYDEKARRAWLALADAYQSLDAHEEALDATINAVRHDPLDTDANASLIRRLVERGQGSRARQAFLEFDAMMFRELGCHAPLAVRAAFGVPVLEREEEPIAVETNLRNVVRRPSPLFGREDLLEAIEASISQPGSCLLLIGTMGAGKTHLIRESAWRFARSHSLSVQIGGVPERVADGLFVIDANLDIRQLTCKVAEAIQLGWRVIAESRTRLDADGIAQIVVNPLPTPAKQDKTESLFGNPSVQLLVSQVSDGGLIKSNPNELAHVAELARRLDGHPGALKAFSSRLMIQTTEQIVRSIDSMLLDFVSDSKASGESICTGLSEMVSDLPQHVLDAFLALCMLDGASLDLACRFSEPHNCTDVWRLLEARSLITVQDQGNNRRFRVPYPIAVAARKSLGAQDASETAARCWKCVADWAFEKSRQLTGPNQEHEFACLEAELYNLKRGIIWATQYDPALAAYIAVGMWRTVCARGNPSVDGDILLMAAQRGAPLQAPRIAGESWTGSAIALSIAGRLEEAENAYLAGIEKYISGNSVEGEAWAKVNYASYVLAKTDTKRALETMKLAAELTTNPDLEALALSDYANILASTGEISESVRVAEEVFATRIQSSCPTARARAYVDLSELYRAIGRFEAARPLLIEGIRKLREAGIQNMLLDQLVELAEISLTDTYGDWECVSRVLEEANGIASRIGSRTRLLDIARLRIVLASRKGDRIGFIAATQDTFQCTQATQSASARDKSLRLLADELSRLKLVDYSNSIRMALGDEIVGPYNAGWKSLLSSTSHETICVLATVLTNEALS